MPNRSKKLKVCLSTEYREELEGICRRQSVAAAKVRRARVLLMSDEDHPDGRRRDWEIAEVVGISERQVVRIRQQFVREGDRHATGGTTQGQVHITTGPVSVSCCRFFCRVNLS